MRVDKGKVGRDYLVKQETPSEAAIVLHALISRVSLICKFPQPLSALLKKTSILL